MKLRYLIGIILGSTKEQDPCTTLDLDASKKPGIW